MGFNIVIVVILAVFLMNLPIDVYCHNNGEQKSKHDLIEELLNPSHYDSSVPPPTGKSTEVTIQLIINDTISENEQASEITSLTTVSMQWIDSRLNYTAPFSSVIIRGSDKRKPWVPGIFFPKNREPYITGFSKKNELIVFNSTGNVAFNDRITTRMLCDMNLKYYPYDVQHCQISLQSYAFTHEDVQLSWLSVNPVIVPVNSMKSVSLTKYDTVVSYVIDSGGNFSTLITTLNITRNSTADNQVIGTPVVLVLIGALSLSFGDNFTPRIALCGAALMTIIMHWAGIYNKIQPAAALICLDNWMFANLIFVGVIISYTAIRHHVKHPGERKKFKHLIEKSIRKQVGDTKRDDKVMWDSVKTWVPDKYIKHPSDASEKNKNGKSPSNTTSHPKKLEKGVSPPNENIQIAQIEEIPSEANALLQKTQSGESQPNKTSRTKKLEKGVSPPNENIQIAQIEEIPSEANALLQKTQSGESQPNKTSRTKKLEKGVSPPNEKTQIAQIEEIPSDANALLQKTQSGEGQSDGNSVNNELKKETPYIQKSPFNKRTLTQFPWTVNRIFYAVGEDELRKKYFTEYVMENESKCCNPICKLHTRIFLCDIGFVISFLVVYILFVVLYVVNWQQKL